MTKSISIIIPAYNEEGRLEATLSGYLSFFDKKHDFEIIVVLNGCTDNTFDVVSRFLPSEKLKYMTFDRKIGKGGAVMAGFRAASKEHLGYVDADGSTKPEDFLDLFRQMNGFDGIIASRHVAGAVVEKKQPLGRLIASRGFNLLVRVLFGFPFKDTQCGAKIFKKEVITRILPEVVTADWAFDIDLLFRADQHGFRIGEAPTVWNNSGDSKLELGRTIPVMLFSVLRLRLLSSPLKGVMGFCCRACCRAAGKHAGQRRRR